jgi:hypothetical protein
MIIEEIDKFWRENKGFNDKLQSWLEQIKKTQKQAKEAKQHFHRWDPLPVYVTAGRCAGKNMFSFSLRFQGQEVATLVVQGTDVHLKISKKTAKTNKQYFSYSELSAGKYEWSGKKAANFRKWFSKNKSNKMILHSEEHRIESHFIEEMRSKSSTKFGGILKGIQPVMLSDFPLQFPLPISGSSGVPKATTGHIDILARRKPNKGQVCLSVWELKAPGKYNNALSEGYIYTVTLLKMLRDPKLGDEWYKIFGFNGRIPSMLHVECVIAITKDQESKLKKDVMRLNLPRNIASDLIDLSVIYYDKATLNIYAPEPI